MDSGHTALKKILFLALPGVHFFEIAAVQKVFLLANQHRELSDLSGYDPLIRSISGGAVTTAEGMVINTEMVDADPSDVIDLLWVAGSAELSDTADPRPERGDWAELIPKHVLDARRIAATGEGVLALARSGLLQGKRCAVHWSHYDRLRAAHPDQNIVPDILYLQDERIWTCAGATASIDLALAFVEADYNRDLAMTIARNLSLYMKRLGSQPQISSALAAQAEEYEMSETLKRWVEDNISRRDLSLDVLASRVGMSKRTFCRNYKRETGETPLRSVMLIRSLAAKKMLETTQLHISAVVDKCGFLSEEQLESALARLLGMSPSQVAGLLKRSSY